MISTLSTSCHETHFEWGVIRKHASILVYYSKIEPCHNTQNVCRDLNVER